MTVSVVVLARVQPRSDVLVSALLAAGSQLRVGSIGQGVALQLFDDDATLVVTVEVPSLIQVPGEAQRLLGLTSEPEAPYWWIDLRYPTSSDGGPAHRLATSLAEQLQGTVWSSTGSPQR